MFANVLCPFCSQTLLWHLKGPIPVWCSEISWSRFRHATTWRTAQGTVIQFYTINQHRKNNKHHQRHQIESDCLSPSSNSSHTHQTIWFERPCFVLCIRKNNRVIDFQIDIFVLITHETLTTVFLEWYINVACLNIIDKPPFI